MVAGYSLTDPLTIVHTFFVCLPKSIFGSHAAPGRPREAEKLENMKILMFGENGPRVVLMKGRPCARVNSP